MLGVYLSIVLSSEAMKKEILKLFIALEIYLGLLKAKC